MSPEPRYPVRLAVLAASPTLRRLYRGLRVAGFARYEANLMTTGAAIMDPAHGEVLARGGRS